MKNECPHCRRDDCYRHCYEASDGRHLPDPATACCPPQSGATQFLVDYNCRRCGQGGSIRIDPSDIQWE